MEEDFFAIVSADESEAAIADHLLDLASAFRTARSRRRPSARRGSTLSPTSAAPTTGRSKAIGGDEFIAEEIQYHSQILKSLLLRREQDLTIFGLDDAIAKPGILVGHEETGFNFIECQHDASPVRERSIRSPTGCRSNSDQAIDRIDGSALCRGEANPLAGAIGANSDG
jgi:hypothetical protein